MFHLGVRNMPSLKNKIKVVMTVACANDLSGASMRDLTRASPVVHPAIDNLLEGLSECPELDIEVVFGKKYISANDCRKEGNILYTPVFYTPLPFPGMGWSYLARYQAIKKYIKSVKPDIVHAQGTERESGIVAAFSKSPSLLTLHGNFREISKILPSPLLSYNTVNAWLESIAIKKCTSILCISKYTEDSVKSLNKNTHLLPNAVSSVFFNIVKKTVPGRVVCVASISRRKNQISLLKSCEQIAALIPNFDLHFWGDCNTSDPYAVDFLQQIKSRNWAQYCGMASSTQMQNILAEAQLMVLPSIEDNCPVALLEAMAASLPILSTSVGGIPDLIKEGVNGFLVKPAEMDKMAQHIFSLLGSDSIATEMGLRSREIAKKYYSPEYIAQKHLKIYSDLAGKSFFK